jgi:2-polyprenyl-6-hydroxyphenyl methylase/3-demethylubiquinone-9 3-methyltransferase
MESAPPDTVDPAEIEKFNRIAEEWWNPDGKFRPLHIFNPVRIGFVRDIACGHFARDTRSLRPFEGLTLLDIGCGGGLLSEPMARLGFSVVGIDASDKNVRIARSHAEGSGLDLSYAAATPETLVEEGVRFHVVLNMEVIEHVPDIHAFLKSCARLIAPDGFMIVATINRTLKSLALAKIAAEYVLGWLPRGTHDWNRFVRPDDLQRALEAADLSVTRVQGVAFNPVQWEWHLSGDSDVNYMVVAQPLRL